MICILHGYLLDGSGSNLWTQAIVRTLCRAGETVHLMCQEPHPERFDFVGRAIRYDEQTTPTVLFDRSVPYPGSCILHKPKLGNVLPVYVWDKYEEYAQVVPMVELDDATIEDYLARNTAVLEKIVSEHPISAIHANHAVLMSVVAQRVAERHAIPFAIMPHGSAIEYAVKKDPRFYRYGAAAFQRAGRILMIGPELRQRVLTVFGAGVSGLAEKLVTLNLGVDTQLFEPVAPAQRAENIARLAEILRGVERGKSPQLTRTMRHRLSDTMQREMLRKVLAQASDYTAKHVDEDCEAALARVSWEEERIILFVGRLIASKGVQAVVAALPSLLQQEPRARLLIVGHGPLREPLEAMLWALDTGNRGLLRNTVSWGCYFEGCKEPAPFEHVEAYFAQLEAKGELEAYLRTAQQLRVSERVIFTGYLTHAELRYLFPCCDVALFPSIVPEAGPLVFLEALASGVFPLGIYQAGMAASIDAVGEVLSPEVAEQMKLRAEPTQLIPDLLRGTLQALGQRRAYAADLRRAAVERYDWTAIGARLLSTLNTLRAA